MMTLQWVDWLVLVPIAIVLMARFMLMCEGLFLAFRLYCRRSIIEAAREFRAAERCLGYVIGCALAIALYWKFLAG